MDVKAIISVLLAVVMLASIIGTMWNRIKVARGIGWQIIRFSTITIALPLVGILALNGALDEASTAIIAGALGYAFAKSDEKEPNA
jgi:ABC-type transport system involved in cytochrome c biogenesis permease subunit